MRRGCVKEVRLEKFAEALKDPATGLTYPALTGVRAQSVEDVEQLFGDGMIEFMRKHKYEPEAQYLQHIRNWRRAVDERGLSDSFRQELNTGFLDFILEDLMPWYSAENVNFSLLEVNR